MTIEDRSPEELLREIENDTSTQWYERVAKLVQVRNIYESRKDSNKAEQIQWEINVFYQRPILSSARRKDNGSKADRFVNLFSVPDKGLDYLQERVRETQNPIRRSLYSDFIWERRRGHQYAEIAIDSYLECGEIYIKNKSYIELVDSVDRAIELALRLNNLERIERARSRAIEILDALKGNQEFRWCLEISDSLLEIRDQTDVSVYERVATILDLAADHYGKTKQYELMRAFLRVLVKYARLLKKENLVQKYLHEIASSHEIEGDERITESGLIAGVSYENAIKEYGALGEKEKVRQLLVKLKEASRKATAEMKCIEVPVKIPADTEERLIETFTTCSLEEAVHKMATSNYFLPSISGARALAKEIRSEQPLSFVLPTTHIRHDDPVAKSSDPDRLLDDHTIQYFSMDYQLRMLQLSKIFDRLEKTGVPIWSRTKRLNSSVLMDYLSSSELYPKQNLSIIKIGLDRFFDNDYVSAIHILTPQLEAVLRHLLEKLGQPTTIAKKDAIMERHLDEILRDEAMNAFLGEDMIFYLKTFLVDKRSQNLRHEVAHGLIELDACNKRNAVTLIHQLLRLSRCVLPKARRNC